MTIDMLVSNFPNRVFYKEIVIFNSPINYNVQ